MTNVILKDAGGNVIATVPIVLGAAPTTAWQTPTPRAVTHHGEAGLTVQSGHAYIGCPGLVIPDPIPDHVTIQVHATDGVSFPTMIHGTVDAWLGGFGPTDMFPTIDRDDGKDDLQIKPNTAGRNPSGVTLAWVHWLGIARPAGSTAHADALQILGGTDITLGGCLFENVASDCQAFFAKPDLGVIQRVMLDGVTFKNVQHSNCIRIDTSGSVPGPFTIKNCNLGGKNAAITASIVPSVVWQNNSGGVLQSVGVGA